MQVVGDGALDVPLVWVFFNTISRAVSSCSAFFVPYRHQPL